MSGSGVFLSRVDPKLGRGYEAAALTVQTEGVAVEVLAFGRSAIGRVVTTGP